MLLMLAAVAALAGKGDDNPKKVIAQAQRREGKLAVGQVAPDAPVVQRDGTATTLLAHKKAGRPLVVVFGSFT
jgi:cytochrome oxidase Cu insertion factor (SCO1/SenC/PrrC family)